MANATSQVPKRSRSLGFYVLTGAAFVAFSIPGIGALGAGISHVIDRFKFGSQATKELKLRTQFYRNQIAAQLHISPDNVTVQDFKLAAQLNPQLAKAYDEVIHEKDKNNRESMLINGGVAAASTVGAGGIVKVAADGVTGVKLLGGAAEMAAIAAGAMSGGAVAGVFTKDKVSAQELVEAMQTDLETVKQRGEDPRHAIKPRLVFALRVAQDEALGEEIKKLYGKQFHKMNEAEQTQVMHGFPALANAATSESYAVATGMMPVQELMATAPNLNGVAAKYALGTKNSSFTDRLEAERAQAQRVANMAPAV